MNLELNFPVVGLDGNPLTEESVGRVLALELARSNAGPALLIQEFAEKLWKNEPVQLSGDEITSFSKLVDSMGQLPVIVRAAVLRKLNESALSGPPQVEQKAN